MTRARWAALACAAVVAACVPACNNQSSPSPSAPSTPQTPAVSVAAPTVVLGRPTDRAIVASLASTADLDAYVEWGTSPGTYGSTSPTQSLTATSPVTLAMDGLRASTHYVYRVRYRARGESAFRADVEHGFQTQRARGESFTFDIQADPHLDDNSSTAVYDRTLHNELDDRPDFLVDLGDTSMAEKCVVAGPVLCAAPSPHTEAGVRARTALARSWFETVTHSVPLFLVLGNHDGESGWVASAAAPQLDTWSVTARTALFPNPVPDGFYTGSTDAAPAGGLRQNYYAFEWGDALFVTLDPYTYTTRKPGSDGWGWTLGAQQYQWLAQTLAGSRARFKFVFSHHLLGGNGSESRGGAAFAPFYEWGGRNADGSWGFDRQRPGWAAPVHQLMVNAHVTAWFHGHDHLYAHEALDGIAYQEVPQPSLARYDQPDAGAGYGYLGSIGTNMFPSSGHLRVSVTSGGVQVDYVRSVAAGDETATRKNATVIQSYALP